MKTLLNPNFLWVFKIKSVFAGYKRAHFHTKNHFFQDLRICSELISAISTHSKIIKSGFLNDRVIINHLINCYVRLHRIERAHQLLDEMSQPNVVSWTSVMAGYNEKCQPETTLWLFEQMAKCSVSPNDFTFATMINACSSLSNSKKGREIHAQIEIFGFGDNLVVSSSLINMYGKCNDVNAARLVFDSMPCKNVISWTSMISAYAQDGQGYLALQLFREFIYSKFDSPNHFMLASVISACASLGMLSAGKAAHGTVIRHSHDSNDVVASALVDMYAKCGCIYYSDKLFRQIINPSVIPYTSIIVSAAKYGLGRVALELFDEMIDKGLQPNHVTFIGVLHACSHSGLISEGLQHFTSMFKKHGLVPEMKHYVCVVDMLGRIGRIDEAYKLALSTPPNSDDGALLWGAILSASRLHGRVDIAIKAHRQLVEAKQQVAGAYVTLSNTYALGGDLETANRLRVEMKKAGVQKEPGRSWVEIKDSVYVFYAGDLSSCVQSVEIVKVLGKLEEEMKERGYVRSSVGMVYVDVEEEAKEVIIGLHSERVALGFGLINTPKGTTIRIMKNLRMCWDCHQAFKLISEIVGRDFVVRDLNRFHHFQNGSCTCKDFW